MSMGSRGGAGGLLAFVLGLALLHSGCSRPPPPVQQGRGQGALEDQLASAREMLNSSGDLTASRNAVQALRQVIDDLPKEKRTELGPETRKLLAGRYGLTEDEISEAAAANVTALDAAYLESCLLFRDAANGLGLEGLSPAERAAAAFRWCMRQVRHQERGGVLIPAHLVLRRGWGSSLERSLVFGAVLQQLGLDSCLVTLPGPAQDQPRYWLCGVLVAGAKGPDLLLFDPRLGLPLPGPKGQGIATLAELRTDPALLKQLSAEKEEYDVTAEQVRGAEIRLAAPLSSLAPRLKLVEELLGPAVRVHLAVDAVALLKKFDAAAAALPEGTRPPVRAAHVAMIALRSHLPPTEGGTATKGQPFVLDIPMEYFPKELKIGGSLENFLENHFAQPFADFALATRMPLHESLRGRFIYLGKRTNPSADRLPFDAAPDAGAARAGNVGKRDEIRVEADRAGRDAGVQAPAETLDRARMPRDLVLRGRLNEAAELLVGMERQLRTQRERLAKMPDLGKDIAAWRERMITAQGNLLQAAQGNLPPERARFERDRELGEGQKYWLPALEGRAAIPMLEEVMYQLALCNHEKAERLQARLARTKTPGETMTREARDAWREAANSWDTFLEEHGKRLLAGAARRWRARVYEVLSDKDAAVRLLQVESPDLAPLERLARAYEARRLKTP